MTVIEAIEVLKTHSLVLGGKMVGNPSNEEVIEAIKISTFLMENIILSKR